MTTVLLRAGGDITKKRRSGWIRLEQLEDRRLLAAGTADFYEVDENQTGTPNTLEAASVLGNDANATVAELAGSPSHAAMFAFNADGTFTYTPATGYQGQDSFSYRPGDGASFGDPVTVTIKVNNQPLAQSADYDYQGGSGPVQFHIADFAYDIDDTEFVFVPPLDDWHLQGPVHGTVVLSADRQTFTYTPNPSYTGDDSFQFRVNDGHVSSNEGTIRLHNIASALEVVAVEDFFEMAAGTTLSLPAPFLLMNDDNNSGTGTLSVESFAPSGQGTVDVHPDGSFSFTPSAGFSGNATFTYTITNGTAVSAPATVLIHVSGAAQVAAGDYYFVEPGQTINIAGPGVLANDVYSGAAPAVNIEKSVGAGLLTLNADGSFSYTAPANPTEPFTYFRYQHGAGGSADRIATVYLIFSMPVAPPPPVISGTAGNDTFHISTDSGGELLVWRNAPVGGPATHTFAAGSISSLRIDGLGGDDTLTIDLANAAANPLAFNIQFDGGDGADQLTLANPPAGAAMGLTATALQMNASHAAHARVERFSVASGAPVIDLGSLSVAAGLRLTLPDNPAAVLRTASLSLPAGATLDMRKTRLIVQAPAGAEVPLQAILNLVAGGRNGPVLWGGSGITTSSADADHGLLTLLNDTGSSTIFPGIGGVALDRRSILVMYALNGDCNADGVVDAQDYAHLNQAFLNGSARPQDGDADYNGRVDGDDFFLADRILSRQGLISAPAIPVALTTPTAEPAAIAPESTHSAGLFSSVPIAPAAEDDDPEWQSAVAELLAVDA